MDKTLSLVFALALTACGAESSTLPTGDASVAADCPRTGIGRVEVDGGVCVYTCFADTVACPGVGCVDLAGNPEHCGACGNSCQLPNRCELRTGVTPETWFCRRNP
jgi:hypothetical protein